LIPQNVTEICSPVSQKCQPLSISFRALAVTLYLNVAAFYTTKQKRGNVPELCRNLTY
jgi:hypothetical protein